MSNTTEVTYYESGGSSQVDAGPGEIRADVASFLSQESDVVSRAKERHREQLRKERLASVQPTAVRLHLTEADSIVRAATALGYSAVPPASPTLAAGRSVVLMQNGAGERIALQTTNGRVVLAGSVLPVIHAVMRERTVQAVRQHLNTKWAGVTTRTLANGVLEIGAREVQAPAGSSPATLSVRIEADGRSHLDIDHVKGNRCEKILKEYVVGTGGKATTIKKKSAYFQMPGEPARVKV